LEKKQGSNPLIWNFRGAAYLGKGDQAKARESFTQALKLDARFFPAAVNLAQLDLRDRQLDAARRRFEDILKADPKHLDAMLALADLALHAKDEKLYLDWLDKAAKAHPQAVKPRVALARHQLARGDKAQALATAREAVNAHPDDPLALETLGAAQLATGDTTNALGTYRKLADTASRPAAPLVRLAAVQASAGQLAEARKSLQDALRLQPDLLEAQMLLGRLDLQQGRHDDALELARQIQQQKPASSSGPLLEGDVAMARQQPAAALTAYERAHAREPSGALLLRQYQALARLGRVEEGEKRLVAWLSSHPQDVETRLSLAGELLKRKRYKAAAAHYLVLDESHPGNVVVLNNLAWSLHEARDPRALAYAEKALELVPGNPVVLDTVGWILVQQGQSARGIKLLQQALSKKPDAAEIQWHLAAAYAKGGEPARARNELTRLLASGMAFPQEKEARALLEQLQEKAH
jgi:putative PEP-CTERM system TPR-repeat lipoprotein